jgi:hypothetical protein
MNSNSQKKILAIFGSSGGNTLYVRELRAYFGDQYRLGVIDNKDNFRYLKESQKTFDVVIPCDFTTPQSITESMAPYQQDLAAVTCYSEAKMALFRQLLPHIPYLPTPTVESIRWATNKIEMRKHFHAHAPDIAPKFFIVTNASNQNVKKIDAALEFPVVVKPAGLAASRLVTIAYHRNELQDVLKTVFGKITHLYESTGRTDTPQVLVEEFIEGAMYTIDAYVDSKGRPYFCPTVSVKTGREIGFDDFFGYQQMTPTRLNSDSVVQARKASTKAIRALGLRSTSAHVELFKTEEGWKVIEIGPRIGGFRHNLYKFSFGMNHIANDMLNKLGKKPEISTENIAHSVAMRIYAKKEGVITKLGGVRKIKDLSSLKTLTILKKKGERTEFAKHGGSGVLAIILSNTTRAGLLADIRRLEQAVKIETK